MTLRGGSFVSGKIFQTAIVLFCDGRRRLHPIGHQLAGSVKNGNEHAKSTVGCGSGDLLSFDGSIGCLHERRFCFVLGSKRIDAIRIQKLEAGRVRGAQASRSQRGNIRSRRRGVTHEPAAGGKTVGCAGCLIDGGRADEYESRDARGVGRLLVQV